MVVGRIDIRRSDTYHKGRYPMCYDVTIGVSTRGAVITFHGEIPLHQMGMERSPREAATRSDLLLLSAFPPNSLGGLRHRARSWMLFL